LCSVGTLFRFWYHVHTEKNLATLGRSKSSNRFDGTADVYSLLFADFVATYGSKNRDRPGVNVMNKIFCDFRPFSAKNIGVFLQTQSNDTFLLPKWQQFESKSPFSQFFGENIYKIVTLVPGFDF
jgi:hypothetical protein